MIGSAIKESFDQRFTLARRLDKEQLVSEFDQAILTLMDAEKGSFFTCLNDTYFVEEKHIYQKVSEDFTTPGEYFTTKLNCLCLETGIMGLFKWEYFDELRISIAIEQTSFKQIKNNRGGAVKNQEDVKRIAKQKAPLVYDEQNFYFKNEWPALFQQSQKVYIYEFATQRNSLCLTIEKWIDSDLDPKIYLSRTVEPYQVSIMSKQAATDDSLQTN
jgi:hypothetical protein